MLFNWLKTERRNEWLSKLQPPAWEGWLRENVWQFSQLDDRQRQRVREFVCVLFHEKNWEGGGGHAVTDEMRVTIAGQAALSTLGFEKPFYFDRLKSIIVYSGSYRRQPRSTEGLILARLQEPKSSSGIVLGQSWQGGPIILAGDIVMRDGRNARRRRSVVLHEFAHHMDSLNGSTDGNPPMTSFGFEKRWYEVTTKEYRRLLQSARRKEATLLDYYGATSQEEFFAVSTECFFTAPHELAREHQDLYEVLVQFFGQDPREWITPQHDASQIA